MANASCGELYIGNTINVEIEGLQNQTTEAYINDATCTFDLKTEAGTIFGSQDDVSMSYVASSDGRYVGVLPSTVALVEGTHYWVEITATKSGVGVGFWRFEKVAKYRR